MNTTVIGDRKAVKRNCPLCGRDSDTAMNNKYSDQMWVMKSCPVCALVYLQYAPVYEELVEDFAWEVTATSRGIERKKKHPIKTWLSKHTRWRLHLFKRNRIEDIITRYASDGNVIDIGCGKGTQLKQLPDQFVPFGIEISKNEASFATEYVSQRGGKIVNASALDGLREFPENFANCIVMRSYLEHEANPKNVMEEIYRILKPGGVVIIKVPNFACFNRMLLGSYWSGFRFPDHLNYFTPQTLLRICKDAGLGILTFGIMDRLSLRDNMWLVAGKSE